MMYVSGRMHELHAFVMLSAPWWRPGNEEKRNDPPLKNWFRLSVRISS